MNPVQILYRISNNSYNKLRTSYSSKEECLKNALNVFVGNNISWIIYGDNLNTETYSMVMSLIADRKDVTYIPINTGSGAASFNVALTQAITYPSETIICFLEDDYAWSKKSLKMIYDGFKLGSDYVTLYVHPDKFIPASLGGNPEVDEDGGYLTKLYQGEKYLWFLVNSTTMTFMSKVSTLRKDEQILRKYTQGTYPRDFDMFLELRSIGRTLMCPVESGCTHLEQKWLAPFKDWENEMKESYEILHKTEDQSIT